jgi:ribonuclease HIII
LTGYIAGVDESGKGDFFGPLVVAAAAISVLERPLLEELYVRDSKKMTDQRAATIAAELKKHVPHSIVVIMPEKYNELYLKIGNLNKLLAWGHARAIENLLEKTPCDTVISDKFGKEELLERSLMERGKTVKLIQQVRGESELSVAAASVLARAEFVNCLHRLSQEWQLDIPKGAASHVDQAGAAFIRKYGEAKLNQVAKLHFKNLQKVHVLAGRLL